MLTILYLIALVIPFIFLRFSPIDGNKEKLIRENEILHDLTRCEDYCSDWSLYYYKTDGSPVYYRNWSK